MKRLCYMIVVLVLLMFVVGCDDAVKSSAQIMQGGVAEILDGSHEVNGVATQVTKDTIVIEGINIKDTLLAEDPQGEWKSVITDDTVGFVFVPSKDIPASSTGFPKKALVAGQEYPIEVTIDEDTGMSVVGSDIVGDELNTKENETDGSGSGTDGSGSGTNGSETAKKKIVYVATPQTKAELQALIAERIKRDGDQADLNDIDVRNVTDMRDLFFHSSFNGDISQWDVSNVTTIRGMFYYSSFNGDISQWDVSNITTMKGTFWGTSFNGDISQWDVGKVTDMSYMFWKAPFNQDISDWDVSNVTNMLAIFTETPFNQDLSRWDVSNVTNMEYMFKLTPFNQDISSWDVSNVDSTHEMFRESSFNQDISGWDVRNVTNMSNMFMNAKKITYNFEAWGSKLRSGVNKNSAWNGSGVEAAGNKPSWA